MIKKVLVIVNPIAGSGRGRWLVKPLNNALKKNDFEPVVKVITQVGEAYQEAATRDDYLAIVCVGGDGTVNEIINGLIDSHNNKRLPLGIIPAGSGNVIAKELKISRNINKFVAILSQGKTRCLDVGCVHWGKIAINSNTKRTYRYFISMAGIGFDAEITRLYHQNRRGSRLQAHLFSYLPIGLKRSFTYQAPKINIEVDGKLITSQAGFLQIANVRSYGGPFVMVGSAQPDDGWLDVTWFTGRKGRDILRYYWNAFWSDASQCFDAHHLRGKKINASSKQTVPIQLDGDYCGNLPVEVTIIPQAISILVD